MNISSNNEYQTMTFVVTRDNTMNSDRECISRLEIVVVKYLLWTKRKKSKCKKNTSPTLKEIIISELQSNNLVQIVQWYVLYTWRHRAYPLLPTIDASKLPIVLSKWFKFVVWKLTVGVTTLHCDSFLNNAVKERL